MALPTTSWTAETLGTVTWLLEAMPGWLKSHLGTALESKPGVPIKAKDPGTDYTDESMTSTSWTDE